MGKKGLSMGLEILRNLRAFFRRRVCKQMGMGKIPQSNSDDYLLAGLRVPRFISVAEFSQAWSLFFLIVYELHE
jgi:hypothetical protein